MGEEVRISDYVSLAGEEEEEDDEDDRVSEWELGLPTADDLTPLSQPLIPPELASAFSISPEPRRSILDVKRASHNTLTSLRGNSVSSVNFKHFSDDRTGDDLDPNTDGSDHRKMRRIAEEELVDDSEAMPTENCTDEGKGGVGGKRPRLVWTPQLHKRFVDVVAHLGIKNAVPKTIMQLMNVEGLTRENVASHLQKYRLYLKRMQGGVASDDVAAGSDHLFGSTPPVPQSSNDSGGGSGQHQQHLGMMQIPVVPYHPQMVQLPMQFHHGYGGMMQQQSDRSGGNKFLPYHQNVNPRVDK